LTEAQADAERSRVESEFGLPVCDVFRDGPQVLADRVLREFRQHRKRNPRSASLASQG
jgi:uncharacterized NAD-dependent epimerase/dehydratase family protein